MGTLIFQFPLSFVFSSVSYHIYMSQHFVPEQVRFENLQSSGKSFIYLVLVILNRRRKDERFSSGS